MQWAREGAALETLSVSILLLLVIAASARATEGMPTADASRRDEIITDANLYDHEVAWPYRVQLVEPWKPEGWQGRFGWGAGVLVRVESSGLLRVDFADLGVHEVPAMVTNVVSEANAIRLDNQAKTHPNFVLAVGTALLDTALDPVRPVSNQRMEQAKGFLVAFIDPESAAFAALAGELASLHGRNGSLSLLFPQGEHRDGATLNACRRVGWHEIVLIDRFVPALTRSYLGNAPQPPTLMLVSPEGRLVMSRTWKTGLGAEVRAAMDDAWSGE